MGDVGYEMRHTPAWCYTVSVTPPILKVLDKLIPLSDMAINSLPDKPPHSHTHLATSVPCLDVEKITQLEFGAQRSQTSWH